MPGASTAWTKASFRGVPRAPAAISMSCVTGSGRIPEVSELCPSAYPARRSAA
jgi:hypothetical protein